MADEPLKTKPRTNPNAPIRDNVDIHPADEVHESVQVGPISGEFENIVDCNDPRNTILHIDPAIELQIPFANAAFPTAQVHKIGCNRYTPHRS